MNELTIPIKKLDQDAVLFTKAHTTDAGFDIYSLEDVFILPGEVVKIKTGIAVNIPAGYVGLIMDKSSMGSRGFKIFGGVVDAGYTGEVMVCLGNLNIHSKLELLTNGMAKLCSLIGMTKPPKQKDYPNLVMEVKKGQKIAQLVVVENNQFIMFNEVEQFEETERGEKGFGSSGQ